MHNDTNHHIPNQTTHTGSIGAQPSRRPTLTWSVIGGNVEGSWGLHEARRPEYLSAVPSRTGPEQVHPAVDRTGLLRREAV